MPLMREEEIMIVDVGRIPSHKGGEEEKNGARIVEGAIECQGWLVDDVRPLVLDPGFSWLAHNPVGAAKEFRLRALYLLVSPFFYGLAIYGFVKYWLWRLVARPKGIAMLGLDLELTLFGGAHPLLRVAHRGVTSWTALAVLYAAVLVAKKERGWRGWLFRLWMFHPECQAVRNRLLEVRDRIYGECELLVDRGQTEINIAALACGSAAAVLWAVYQFQKDHPGVAVNVTLVDRDENSIALAVELAEKLNVAVTTIVADIGATLSQWKLSGDRFDVVEETGFLDYRRDGSVVKNTQAVRSVVKRGGLFLTAQIDATWSASHRKWTIGWLMLIPRSMKKFVGLLEEAGYKRENMDTYTEPWGVYHIVSIRC